MTRLAVVGAGWSGLAAAVTLRQRLPRAEVHLFDAALQAGGRARALTLDFDGETVHVDNGQHLLVGAYTATLALLDSVGRDEAQSFDRVPLDLHTGDGFRLRRRAVSGHGVAGALSALVALAGARGLTAADKASLLRTLADATRTRWRAPDGVRTVAQWWQTTRQRPAVIARLWRPLAIGTLNTGPAQACAQTFLNVLRDTLGAPAHASDFLLPRGTLSDAFVDPVLRWLVAHGVHWRPGTPVRGVASAGGAAAVGPPAAAQTDAGTRPACAAGTDGGHRTRLDVDATAFDAVIVATPAINAARLLSLPADHPLNAFEYRPITTAWCGWREAGAPAPVPPSQQLLVDRPEASEYGQWWFDRGRQGDWRTGGIVISDSRALLTDDPDAVHAGLIRQCRVQLGLRAPDAVRLVTDRRATLACTPDRPRLRPDAVRDRHPGVWLAGDHLWPDYPATLEAAVRAGVAAADAVAAQCISLHPAVSPRRT